MEAVIVSGGKQYRVREGDVVRLERLGREQGATVEFRHIAYLRGDDGPTVTPEALAEARVVGQVVRIGRGRKLVILRFKRRKNVSRKQGHRQGYTAVRITRIEVGPGASVTESPTASPGDPEASLPPVGVEGAGSIDSGRVD